MTDAFFAPDDTSKNPEIIAFDVSERGSTEQRAPDKAENDITQAQINSIFFAAFDIDSVITWEKGKRGRGKLNFEIFVLLLFQGLKINPTIIAERIMLVYTASPIFFDESIDTPTPLMTNGADGTFINVRRCSISSFDISPLSNISEAASAPTG